MPRAGRFASEDRDSRYRLCLVRRWLASFGFERGGLIALATLVAYVWLAPPHIADGDNAEFATLGSLGGVAHPSGYPLYLLWLRATAWLPSQSPAHAAAIATAFLGAAQVLVLHAACRAWGARATAASLAVGLFAAGPIVLRIQTEAEVFALNGLIAALVLWLAAAEGPLRGGRRTFALGLVAGLGLSNHLTCVLVAPVGILGAVRGIREAAQPRWATLALAVLGLVCGLLPYLYLMVTPDSILSWTRIDDLGDLLHHFLRNDYGGPGKFSPVGTGVPVLTSLTAMAGTIGRAWLWLPLVLGLGAAVARIVRSRGSESRWGWAMLLAAIALSGPVLASRFNVIPEGLGLYVVRRFHILPALLLAPAVAVGFDQVGTWMQRRFPHASLRSDRIGALISVVAFASFLGGSLPHLLRVHSPAVELALKNTLRSLPQNSVLIVHSDLALFGFGYLQGALGERTDVAVIMWPQISSIVYRERLARRNGIEIVPRSTGITTVELAEQVLAMKRPLFVDPFNSNIAKSFPSYPYGIVFRVLGREERLPESTVVFELNRSLFEGFDLGYPIPGHDDEYATELHMQYARAWSMIAQRLAATGHREQQAIANAFEAALAPRD